MSQNKLLYRLTTITHSYKELQCYLSPKEHISSEKQELHRVNSIYKDLNNVEHSSRKIRRLNKPEKRFSEKISRNLSGLENLSFDDEFISLGNGFILKAE